MRDLMDPAPRRPSKSYWQFLVSHAGSVPAAATMIHCAQKDVQAFMEGDARSSWAEAELLRRLIEERESDWESRRAWRHEIIREYWDELTVQEIADIVGVTKRTVHNDANLLGLSKRANAPSPWLQKPSSA